ncbi:MAG: hypothetical protein ACR2N4_06500 [Jatrophihabitans sp.]
MPEIPALAKTIESKFNALLARVRKLETADPLQNATIHKGGIKIVDGGTITVIDADGHTVALIGALPTAFNRTDGSRQPGFVLYREDGTTAAFLGDLNATTPPYKQALQLLDRTGNIIIADDTNGGVGLARPYVPMGSWVDNLAAGSSATPTTSAAYVIQQIAYAYVQHPKVRIDVIANSTAAGTGGAIGLFNQFGNQVGGDIAVPANAVSYLSLGPIAMYPGWAFGDNGYWTLRAKRTAGTGAIGVRGVGFWGVQS